MFLFEHVAFHLRRTLAFTQFLYVAPRFRYRTINTLLDLKPFNSKITGFMKNGLVEDAQQVFDKMPHKNTVSYNAMIRGYFQNGFHEEAVCLYNQMPIRDAFSYNTMISGLMRCGDVKGAEDVFRTMEGKDVVTWNSLISGYVANDLVDDALKVFDEMPVKDVVSWNLVLGGLVKVGEFSKAEKLFEKIETRDVASWTIMVKAFLDSGKIIEARRIFDDMPLKDIQAWNTIISGYVLQKCVEIAECLFHKMPEKDGSSWSIMMDGFLGIRRINDALRLFYETPHRSQKSWNSIVLEFVKNNMVREAHAILEKSPFSCIVSWTNIMIGYFDAGEVENAADVFRSMRGRDTASYNAAIFGLGEHDEFEEGIKLFIKMKEDGLLMDEATFTSFFTICSNLPSLHLGKQVHAEAIKFGIDCFGAVGNALITMYFRCGEMDSGLLEFKLVVSRNTISWNSVICGLAHHGQGEKAIEMFENMRLSSMKPDEITFVGVLSACSHAGLLAHGRHYFNVMKDECFIQAKTEHYTCMVDLLGRFGQIDEAINLLGEMERNGVAIRASVWGALLGACRMHKNIVVGEIAAEKILELQPSNSGTYMILAEMYISKRMREKAYGMWNRMRENGLKKQPGCSWIESSVDGKVFLAGDTTHPDFKNTSFALHLIYQDMGFLNAGRF